MNKVRSILEDAYQYAESQSNSHFELSESQQKWVETIVEKSESQKAVLAVLITSITKKIETSTQDVRCHKTELPNGYSGRGFDTRYITPFIHEKFQRFARKFIYGIGMNYWNLCCKKLILNKGINRQVV